MTFLQPWWWLLLGLAVPLLLWHGRRRRVIRVPAVHPWRNMAIPAGSPRARFRPPRPSASLLLQLAALVLLAAALSGPRPAGTVPDHRVYVLDASGSMNAVHEGGTRFGLAAERLRDRLRHQDPFRRGGPELSLLAVSDEVRAVAVRAENPVALLAALEGVRAEPGRSGAGWASLGSVLEGIAAPDEDLRIEVLTDGAGAAEARAALEDAPYEEVDIRSFGAGAATAGFAAVRAAPVDEAEGTWRVEGDLVGYPRPEEPIEISVSYAREGLEGELPWDEVTVRPTGERTAFSFEVELPGAGVLTLRLPGDALPQDDVARVALRSEPVPLRIGVWGEAPMPLLAALSTIESAQLRRFADGEPGEDLDLAVVAGDASFPERPASVVLWTAGASPDGFGAAPVEDPGAVRTADAPAGFTVVGDLRTDVLPVVHHLDAPSSADVLAFAGDAPLLWVERKDGESDVVAAWDLGAGEWSRELGFSVLLTEIARAAQPRAGAWTDPRCIVGAPCSGVANGMERAGDVEATPEADVQVSGSAVAEEPGLRGALVDRLLVALAAVLLALDGLLTARSGGRIFAAPARRWAARGARAAGVACLLAVAAGVPAPTLHAAERIVFVVDAYASDVALPDVPEARRAVVAAEGNGRLVADFGEPWNGPLPLPAEPLGSDPERVLDLAEGLLAGRSGRIVLSGAPWPGNVVDSEVGARLSASGVPVDALVSARPTAADAWIERLEVDERVYSGVHAEVQVSLGGASDGARARVSWDDHEVGVAAHGEVLSFEPGPVGTRLLEAELLGGGDDRRANDAFARLVDVHPAGRVVLVARQEVEAEAFAERLGEAGYEVASWTPRDVPVAVDEFLEHDVVALLDVPASDLHVRQQEALEAWIVDHGGGVLLAGAEAAYGPGGYLRTPLENLSPLSARVPGEQPKAALAFVLDRSGSMQQASQGVSRLAVAKEAAVAAAELLHPESQVAVVVFDDLARTLLPLGDASRLPAALAPLVPGGGTNLYPALQEAFTQLLGSDADARHMIVMTDGLAQSAPFDPLIDEIVETGITISTVAIGRGADVSMLQSIARRGGGAFHANQDAAALPSILSQEAMLLSGSPVREEAIRPRSEGGRAAFVSELPSSFPEIPGYVRTTPKGEAEVHATAPNGDPIMASWRHGIGRVIALSTPLTGPWGEAWTDEPFAQAFPAQAFRWLRTPALRPGAHLSVTREGDELHVHANPVAESGEPLTGARWSLVAAGPGGWNRTGIDVQEVAPGAYRAIVPAHAPGRYRMDLVPLDTRSVGEGLEASIEYHVSYPSALAWNGETPSATRVLVAATGGTVADVGSWLPRRGVRLGTEDRFALWVVLALLAVAAGFVADARVGRAPTVEAGRGGRIRAS